jgi:hypothetical protein
VTTAMQYASQAQAFLASAFSKSLDAVRNNQGCDKVPNN